jgi:hypothetical protein
MEIIQEVWRRALSVQPVPPPSVVTLIAVAALAGVLVPAVWPVTRLMVTITHEGAHAFAALLAGRRLQGIRLHSDTSGLTVSRGRAAGPGMVLMLAAGYLGPALLGLGAALLLGAGRSLGLLWLLLAVLTLMLLQIRNFYGFAVIVLGGLAVFAVTWYLSPTAQSTVAYLITWILLIAAPKPVLELMGQRRRGLGLHSDADQLARLTRVPGLVWTWLFLLANLVGLAVGTALLLPGLSELVQTTLVRLAD